MLKIIQTRKAGKNVSGKNKKWMLKWIAGTEFLIRFPDCIKGMRNFISTKGYNKLAE